MNFYCPHCDDMLEPGQLRAHFAICRGLNNENEVLNVNLRDRAIRAIIEGV